MDLYIRAAIVMGLNIRATMVMGLLNATIFMGLDIRAMGLLGSNKQHRATSNTVDITNENVL